MLDTTAIHVTAHARERWRQRTGRDEAELLPAVRAAHRLGEQQSRRVKGLMGRERWRAIKDTGCCVFGGAHGSYFLCRFVDVGRLVVITVLAESMWIEKTGAAS